MITVRKADDRGHLRGRKNGRLVDETVRGTVARQLAGFAEFIARVGRAR